jgi:hypothetical protein
MDALLLALCKQTITKYSYISSNRDNDYAWHTVVTGSSIVLTGVVEVTLHVNMISGTLVVTNSAGTVTYVVNIDYTINYTTGKIKRTATSTITSGQTVKVSYNYETITTIACRIEHKNILIRNALGQETLSSCQIYCDGSTVIDIKDKITSTDFDVDYPEILAINSNPDENGDIDHKLVYTK